MRSPRWLSLVSSGERGGQGRAAAAQTRDIAGVVIGDAVLPAAKRDADPLEGQGPDGGVMAFPGLDLPLIVDARPVAEADRMAGPFVKRLAEKPRTSPSGVNPYALAAPLQNRGDATEFLHIGRRGVTLTQRSEGGQQARRQGRTRPRERIEDRKVGMRPGDLLDPPFYLRDALTQGGDQLHQGLGHLHGGLDHGCIADRRNGLGDLLQPLVHRLLAAAVVPGPERTQGRKAARNCAAARGWIGYTCRFAYLASMNTSAPRDCSTATATGWPSKRADSMDTQDPTASGLCSISPRSRRSEPAACNDQACFRSPQSMPTIAVNLGSWGELASLIRETSFFRGRRLVSAKGL